LNTSLLTFLTTSNFRVQTANNIENTMAARSRSDWQNIWKRKGIRFFCAHIDQYDSIPILPSAWESMAGKSIVHLLPGD
jgi:hypothetical protein